MKHKSWLEEFAKSSGRKELHPYAMGIIKMVMIDNSYTDTEKVNEIEDALLALEQVWKDESLPWDIQREKAHAASMSLKEINLTDFTTLDAVAEELVYPWPEDLIQRQEG